MQEIHLFSIIIISKYYSTTLRITGKRSSDKLEDEVSKFKVKYLYIKSLMR